jgi:hypothetical protein
MANDTTIIAAEGMIGPGFPLYPRSPAELVAFAQVYETLVRVDCDDRLVPALAERWTSDSSSQLWTLTIRGDATFADGTPVTANDVVDAWRERRSVPAAVSARIDPVVDMISVGDVRTLYVHLRDPSPGGPRVLADPLYAVHRTTTASSPPLGTGPYVVPRIDGAAVGPGGSSDVALLPRIPGAGPVLLVRTIPGNDPRDAIDRGADVLATPDRRIVDYTGMRPDLQATALPADRAYALVSTLRSSPANDPDPLSEAQWPRIRASLARDVVRAAPPTSGSAWWRSSGNTCTGGPSSAAPARVARPTTGQRRIVYQASDRLAGEIAQRLVAIASYEGAAGDSVALRQLLPEWFTRTDVPLVAIGLADSALDRSLQRGADLGYVVALPRRTLDACAEWRRLATRIPWLRTDAPILLAEAGPVLIMAPAAPALTVDWQNTLRVITQPPANHRP